MVDISIDIETFSSQTNASIAQIGAVYKKDGFPETFFRVVDDPTGVFDPKTIRWHLAQDGATVGMASEAVTLKQALSEFTTWLEKAGVKNDGDAALWTHATFDIPRIAEAYARAGYRVPWHYRNCRDLRTLYDLAGGRPDVDLPKTHNALEDAARQLREIEVCRTRLHGHIVYE